MVRVPRDQRREGLTFWLTGLPASGKSSVAFAVHRRLAATGRRSCVLDGDEIRQGLSADLGFSAADRAENVRRVGEVAKLLANAGMVAIVALVSPYAADRARVRDSHRAADLPFFEVFVDTPLEVCRARDPQGLYARAGAGQISGFTGVDDPYEPPPAPHLRLRPEHGDAAAQAALVLDLMGGRESDASGTTGRW
jgi:bifunctional enzyme CysN/CysC